ncbi:28S ribosomal protein S18c, mitochondrial [Agrilus planipennis]|uniref:28S ribosomal protein S18c, mitochondrial n=1 Tax=Agrilus planipennis TaxID=224129 RepID=A0A1W4XDL2_AGRPL|nr:28S ribosomal protein S18c, mitochondrial [Agrilus planipennis]
MLQIKIAFRMVSYKFMYSSSRTCSTKLDPDTPKFDMENPFYKEKKICILCKYNITPNYKNIRLLSQFQSPFTGRVYGRHITGLCEHKQKQVEREINKAQTAALMPYYLKDVNFSKDPTLFNVENPVRPHRF